MCQWRKHPRILTTSNYIIQQTMDRNTKDWIQHGSAVAMIVSAIALAFISFFYLLEVHTSVLVYVSEALAYAAGIFGVTLYFRNKIGEAGEHVKREIREQLERMHRDTEIDDEEVVEQLKENDNDNEND